MFDHDKLNVQSNTKEAEDGKSVCCSHDPSVAKSNLGSSLKNQAGEKTRKTKLTLSTEPGNENGKTLAKEFKIFRTGSPEEWILWRRDFNEICAGMAITVGSNCNQMVCQLLSDKTLSQFETRLATHATETNANCNLALDAVAVQTFPNNACAKQKKHSRQGHVEA
jgi:hypothetical protein